MNEKTYTTIFLIDKQHFKVVKALKSVVKSACLI